MPSLMTFDGPYHYSNREGGLSCCRVRIFEDLSSLEYTSWNKTFVIVVYTMLYGHPDMNGGVVNDAEFIATEIRKLQELRQRHRKQRVPQIDTIEWYEHIPASPEASAPESFAHVRFTENAHGVYSDPTWEAVERFYVERRVRQAL